MQRMQAIKSVASSKNHDELCDLDKVSDPKVGYNTDLGFQSLRRGTLFVGQLWLLGNLCPPTHSTCHHNLHTSMLRLLYISAAYPPLSLSLSLLVSQSVSQSVTHSVSHSVSQSVCLSVCLSVGLSLSDTLPSIHPSSHPPTHPSS